MNELQSQTGTYVLVMLAAGIGIPVMATLNASLGVRLQSPATAASILFSVGLLVSIVYLLLTEGVPESVYNATIPFYFYFGGLFVLFYVLSITWVAPRFGLGNAVSLVLLGQLFSMTTIDHFALMGAVHHPISLRRVAGLCFMAVGVFLVVRR